MLPIPTAEPAAASTNNQRDDHMPCLESDANAIFISYLDAKQAIFYYLQMKLRQAMSGTGIECEMQHSAANLPS